MTRTQVQQVVVILLLLVFGFVWMNTRKGPGANPAAVTAPPSEPLTRAAAPGAHPSGTEESAAGEISLPTRNLFQIPAQLIQKIRERERALEASLEPPPPELPPPVEIPAGDLSALNLQGIFWGMDRPQAIINREILSVGDTIGGAKVSAISKEGVSLDYRGQTVELKRKADIRSKETTKGGYGH